MAPQSPAASSGVQPHSAAPQPSAARAQSPWPPSVEASNRSLVEAQCSALKPADVLVSCDRNPPCIINEANMAMLTAKECRARKAYADWPTYDPHLPHAREEDARTRELVRRLGSRTMIVAGDSVSNLDFRGIKCAVQREGLENSSATRAQLVKWRQWGRRHRMSCCGQALGTSLGGAMVFVGVYKYNATMISWLLESCDVLLLNYGLHYRRDLLDSYRSDMERLFRQLSASAPTAGEARRGVSVMLRETTAQHFPGTGVYTPGAERARSCECKAHSPIVSQNNHVLDENAVIANASRELAGGRVPIVPFYALTKPRHDMHNADDKCGGAIRANIAPPRGKGRGRARKQPKRSMCCDCTHLCYTPQLYDAYVAGIEGALASADRGLAAARRSHSAGRRRLLR